MVCKVAKQLTGACPRACSSTPGVLGHWIQHSFPSCHLHVTDFVRKCPLSKGPAKPLGLQWNHKGWERIEAEREGEGLGSGLCGVWKKGCEGTELGSHRGRAGLAGRDWSWPQDWRWGQA